MVENDHACLWTYSRLMEKTEAYCEYREIHCEQLGVTIKGWWMSETALEDVCKYEWPQ